MWNPFKRKKCDKRPYYEVACSLVDVNPAKIADFIDAYIETDGEIAVVVIQTTTRPMMYLTHHPLFAGSVNKKFYWTTQLVPRQEDQATAIHVMRAYQKD